MEYEKVCTLLRDIHNQVLNANGTHITLEQVPIKELQVDDSILKFSDELLTKSPYIADVYIDHAGRSVHPLTDFIVDCYLDHLGVS